MTLWGLSLNFVGTLVVGIAGYRGLSSGWDGGIVWASPTWKFLWFLGWGLLAFGFAMQWFAARGRVTTTPPNEGHAPWHGKPWAAAAEAANRGLNGQGYIVHSMMLASQTGTRLTIAVIFLALVQIAVAIYQTLRCSP